MSDPTDVDQLAMKVAKVMADIGHVPKNGYNDFHNYEYSTDDDVMQSVRPVMAEHNLIALPEVVDREVTEMETNNGTTLHTDLTMQITLIDGDSGQSKTMTWEGEAQDGQDKGLYKAYTSGIKYWALKTFLLSADSDVETHDAASRQSGGGGGYGPTDSQLEFARDLAQKDVWADQETQALLNDRIPGSSGQEISELIDHMKNVVDNGREALNGAK